MRLSERAPRAYRLFTTIRGWVVGERGDYRALLFQEACERIGGKRPARILEIGPKDGLDSRRLLGLNPESLTLVDLPRREAENATWLKNLDATKVQYLSANLMYSEAVLQLPPFDLVWCTGVLYHNPEQLRMVRRLYDLLQPGGLLVLETATVRNQRLRDENVVEIIHPVSEERRQREHLSANVTHLPSRRAVFSWLEMVGFRDIAESACHGPIATPRNRVAYLARKPLETKEGTYYSLGDEAGFAIGKSL